ncbi:UDP-N-acetylglucosamine 1-carboxyvinyltransferase [Peredibacter starrii]|uniref:UDP-N-acetylglucosamine 1-carboxyvinyltransferase n=1 Tax=Peredibacter starrii TaxID=28202 RepID=A0AAX4HMU6_9BACT|nr:UDP-N-acetylglucosamine 1-carboxyvinyltransferase [Peredibacter starrii]WPU64600.1 UDP-N-acetylglucosamine 1-carboxyvinyltransferase [Peredibacter starrii]
MDKLLVTGPCQLKGSVHISSAKNATLPILAATLLCPYPVTFTKIPDLMDVGTIVKLLQSMGVKVSKSGDEIVLDASHLENQHADYSLVKTMRASVLVLGPLLARYGVASVSLPGGCAIGARPVDIHLMGMEKLGAEIQIENGYIKAKCDKLKGAVVTLPFPSVGATENIMMAAVLAEGETVIENAAMEPEIDDLADFLIAQGVNIEGAGTSRITIHGMDIKKLKAPAKPYRVIGDRIEAATFIIAGIMSGGDVKVEGFNPKHLTNVLDTLTKMGANLELGNDFVHVKKSNRLKGAIIDTAPYPGFPTDVQAQMMALMSVVDGNSVVTETIFENRFMHVPEMARMGTKVTIKGNSATIEGVESLSAAPVMCTDLRASAALILCALVAQGQSEIQRVYHLDRGYEKIDEKLTGLGAKIERVKG